MDLHNNNNSSAKDVASPRVAFHTLGCKVNYYETEALREQFRREGFVPVAADAAADIYVINTCTVTHLADRKTRQLICRVKRQNPKSLIVACGCYPQVDPDAVAAIPGVDLLAGTALRLLLPGLIKRRLQGEEIEPPVKPYEGHTGYEEMPWTPDQGRTRAYLKIQDGCDRCCSYCIVPFARGPLRSLPPSRVLGNLREIGAAGYREVVLTGIHLGLYGVDLNPPSSLAALLAEAVRLPGPQRIRLSSLEPADFSDPLISVIAAADSICRHLHIPLQSGDDTILHRMRRQYDTAYFHRLLGELRTAIPDLAISTDIIVGFPGEEERHFQKSFAFVRECGFSRLHVFPFSPRRGTKAAQMGPAVPPVVKKERSRSMIELGVKLSLDFQKSFFGRTLPVLFEKVVGEEAADRQPLLILEGLTSQYLRVRAPAGANLRGQMRYVLLQSSGGAYINGTIFPQS
ncbi:MAG TPA: tRNA (N(6)-L-threonylcarbamoyladenosine(37)-C(2))-methylthiotransferase MtaB [Firmicutes bacterium]|nr:tRNA (N(6)-L-threonylcarbamoyladenosine(37)-C(2))-methylthiotransferase MtaB [Bacillota bacterium]